MPDLRLRDVVVLFALLSIVGLCKSGFGQEPEHRPDGRYYIVGTGDRSSFIVIDTQTGHCWSLLPHLPAEHRWRELGAPPAQRAEDQKTEQEAVKPGVKIEEDANAFPPAERVRQVLRMIENEERRLRDAQRKVAAKKMELLRTLESEGLLHEKLDIEVQLR